MPTRLQLTLIVPEPAANAIEAVRRVLDPVQHALIAGGADAYQSLRATVLGTSTVRIPHPHITLAHPRNPRAPGNDIAIAHQLPSPLRIRFDAVSLIEQRDGAPWRTIWSVPLRPAA